ncbi:UNVERIFIED_CONTAM: hypothetical protein FKN15_022936 [Acipenser sinensis]
MTRRLSDALRMILIVALAGTGSPDHRAVVEIGNVNGTVQHCARTDCCIAAVHLLNNNTNITTQGCSVIQGSCTDLLCLLGPLRRGNYTSCVCSSDLCNSHVAWSQDAVLAHQLSLQDLPQTEKVQATTSPTSLTSPRLDLTNMVLHQVINRGRYAELWKGSLEGVPVVFKLYPSGGCRCYDNESAVYGLALLRHPSIALFLGEGESGQSGERVLVLELAQHGSLRVFLSQHCSDWAGTVRLALSLCQGLSFLHSEIHRDGVYKPAVAHRDLSSNNVLVKADRTCALSDFGSATALNLRPGPRPLRTQEVCVQVGTPRYMPPEILDGTLNIRDPLSSLRQVDVYSLGLLVWEMTTRCTDLWTVSPVPEYRPAYEAELGPSPSLDELVLLLQKEAQLGSRIQCIPLPKKDKDVKPNTECIVDGWGANTTGGGASSRLRAVNVTVVDRKVCKTAWRGQITPRMMCAGGNVGKRGFCQGDSGGPLVCNSKKPTAEGIVSFNELNACDNPQKPNVYTQVSKYLPWIKCIMGSTN